MAANDTERARFMFSFGTIYNWSRVGTYMLLVYYVYYLYMSLNYWHAVLVDTIMRGLIDQSQPVYAEMQIIPR